MFNNGVTYHNAIFAPSTYPPVPQFLSTVACHGWLKKTTREDFTSDLQVSIMINIFRFNLVPRRPWGYEERAWVRGWFRLSTLTTEGFMLCSFIPLVTLFTSIVLSSSAAFTLFLVKRHSRSRTLFLIEHVPWYKVKFTSSMIRPCKIQTTHWIHCNIVPHRSSFPSFQKQLLPPW